NASLAGIVLTFNACDDPITRTNYVATFWRVDPPVYIHNRAAVTASLAVHIRSAEITYDATLPRICFSLCSSEYPQLSILKTLHVFSIIKRMIAVSEPTRCFDDDRLLPELAHRSFLLRARGRGPISRAVRGRKS